MLREYIVSEAMAGLNIPTTRSLAVVGTGAPVYREHVQPGAVLTRIARSHVRVGTFQYAANMDTRRGDGPDLTRALADHLHRPAFPGPRRARRTPMCPSTRRWWRDRRGSSRNGCWSGFIHGVMNTDNMSIAGETIDFGPCAFMDSFNRRQVFSLDRRRRDATPSTGRPR